MSDPFARLSEADRAALLAGPLPTRAGAMLATLTADHFDDPDWIYERKLDGVRCVATRDPGGRVRLLSRNDHDMTATYPEVADALAARTDTDLVVDGEIVAFAGRRTSFERLQGRIGVADAGAARASGIAVHYYVFDLLHVAGHDVRALPNLTRKQLVRAAVDFADPLRYTVHRRRGGLEMFAQACARGDEGVVAKRAAAPYRPGRSKDWLKFKCVRDQELVVGGWTEPRGSRTDFGALLLGYHETSGGTDRLRYAGKVGTGFDDRMLASLGARLRELETSDPPFHDRVREKGAHWARPELVAQIAFTEWTRDGMLRHPRFQGLRTDKDPAEVVREQR